MGAEPRRHSKSLAVKRLVELTTDVGRALATYEIPIGLYDVLLHYFGGIYSARRAAGLADPVYPRKWSLPSLLEELRRLHWEGMPIRYRDLEEAGRGDVVGAVRVYAGGIVRARRLARIPRPPRRSFETEVWDEDRVVEDILELHEAGQPLAYSKAPSVLVSAGCRYFGTWEAAISAAELDYDQIRLRRAPYDDESILVRICELAATRPEMTLGELHEHPEGQAILRRFSSFEQAARKAGVKGWPRRSLGPVMSKREVVAALCARQRAGGKLFKTALQREGGRLWNSARRRFGSLAAALAAAGLASDSPKKIAWTRDEVIRQLKARKENGLPLHARAVQKDMPGLYAAACKFYGSYMAAAGRFGAKPRQRAWTKDDVVRELRKVAGSKKQLSTNDLPGPLKNACFRHFGTISAARSAAGLSGPARGKRRWSRDRVIDELRRRAHSGEPTTDSSFATACWRYFGTVAAAREAAGLNLE